MKIKQMKLGWLTVKDLKKAQKLFTEHLGLSIKRYDEDHRWLELEAPDKQFSLGVWQEGTELPLPGKAGANAIITFFVDDISTAKQELEQQGLTFTSDIYRLPRNVQIADFVDNDGNQFQLVQE